MALSTELVRPEPDVIEIPITFSALCPIASIAVVDVDPNGVGAGELPSAEFTWSW